MTLDNLINSRRYCSFDVFDTAVCRIIHSPEHIHLVVGRKLRNRGIINYSDAEWMYIRAQSEFRSRLKTLHNEVGIAEIYEMMSILTNINSNDARIALELELEEEIRLVRPIASTQLIFNSYRYQDLNIIFVSDTYFSSSFIRSLLLKAGYSNPLDVVCSCEERKSKIHGTVYDHISSKRRINSSSFHHLGDNFLSDVQNARSRGWNSQFFTDSHWTTRERVLAASGDGQFLASAIAGSARSARLSQMKSSKEGIVSAAASAVGPMFTAYTLWVLLDVINRGDCSIYFLARDGQVLAQICQRLVRWLKVNVDVRYIYASRQAFLLPALHKEADNIVDEALEMSYYDQIFLDEALISLKYSSEERLCIANLLPFGLQRISSSLSREEKAALKKVLSSQDFLHSLRSRAREAHDATLAYLHTEGMLSSPEACIVDLGWRGNTQLRLQKFVGERVKLRGYYMGISDTVLRSVDCFHCWTTKVPLKTGLLEVMASADHTSVKGFAFAPDGQPVCSPPIVEDQVLVDWGSRQQQEVVLKFCDYLLDAVEANTFTPQELYHALENGGLDAYHHFRLSPTWIEAESYGSVLHQIDVNHVNFQELAPPISSVDVLRKVFPSNYKPVVTSWFEGSIARSSKESTLCRLAHSYIEQYFKLKARIITKLRRESLKRSARNFISS